ncbi:class I SAM-dependent methyltransferase [Vibrio sp. SS-MA-C1-2]|uniref:class I SAM-dependent methyltransferase n=1 Tax=Vibrio sp. SS-MA-C1-2 TaxID=2908646 RepID=UPI001F346E98|nr:class I SAM-dependent methyltransferase [Vibrio sp. SS-MA-C1-2]UJF17013.1 class I SAM-dependent methyltransferase [Vibrio sp. SS-MA-C1-2]
MNYYNQHAQQFFDGTISVDMSSLYDEFLPLLPSQSLILDAGCGSGRDSDAFKQLGFQVDAIDASDELAKLAEQLINQPVQVTTFQEFKTEKQYDAIWACASLLHVPMFELKETFEKLSSALNVGGIFYCSFKYGDNEVERGGRQFTNLNETLLNDVISTSSLSVIKTWCTADLREGREDEKWLNAVLKKQE